MKLVFVSDIHSNIRALEAVLHAEADADAFYCAGDLVDVGFSPKEVVTLIRERQIPCVQGNHDRKIIEKFREGVDPDKTPENWVELNAQLLEEEDIRYLENLPDRLTFAHDGISWLMTHLYQGYEVITSDYAFDEFWGESPVDAQSPIRAMVMGHTHWQGQMWVGNTAFWLNPGSVGYNRPVDPSIATRYATVIDGKVTFHQLEHPHCQHRKAKQQEFRERFGG
ncbi:MAG: metallophosphatase family protein [Opitutales bacterium]|nr:metallophosphatase family protein [Opitutales bacterium]